MLDKYDFTNLNGQTWQFNTDTCPLKEFVVDGNMKSNPVDRMQEPGEWPVRVIPGATLHHLGGDILRNTAEEYITDRIKMLNTLMPAGVIEDERTMGTITMRYSGMGEDLFSDNVALDAYPSLPMQALYPSVTEFSITFKIFDGYMIGRGSGKFYNI